jgi:hypothetical protein
MKKLIVLGVGFYWQVAFAEGGYDFVWMRPELLQPWYFNNPFGIAIDSSGNVYVADTYNHRIQKFSPLFSVDMFVAPTTILKGETFTLTIIPKDKLGNIITKLGTATLSNKTCSILPEKLSLSGTTTITGTITQSPNGGWDVITVTATIDSVKVTGTSSILVFLPKDGGRIETLLPYGTATASGKFTENF